MKRKQRGAGADRIVDKSRQILFVSALFIWCCRMPASSPPVAIRSIPACHVDAFPALHKTKRPVQTASAVQVQAPVWQEYEDLLQRLVEALNSGDALQSA
jgi:hypothetical protein